MSCSLSKSKVLLNVLGSRSSTSSWLSHVETINEAFRVGDYSSFFVQCLFNLNEAEISKYCSKLGTDTSKHTMHMRTICSQHVVVKDDICKCGLHILKAMICMLRFIRSIWSCASETVHYQKEITSVKKMVRESNVEFFTWFFPKEKS